MCVLSVAFESPGMIDCVYMSFPLSPHYPRCKSEVGTQSWHMHKSSVELNSPSSMLYDFPPQNRMTESHTEVIVLSLCHCREAREPQTLTHQVYKRRATIAHCLSTLLYTFRASCTPTAESRRLMLR